MGIFNRRVKEGRRSRPQAQWYFRRSACMIGPRTDRSLEDFDAAAYMA
jgi:hypothetical protein